MTANHTPTFAIYGKTVSGNPSHGKMRIGNFVACDTNDTCRDNSLTNVNSWHPLAHGPCWTRQDDVIERTRRGIARDAAWWRFYTVAAVLWTVAMAIGVYGALRGV